MANNHQGSVTHAKKIIDEFSDLSKKYNLNAGIKLQFRNLDTFIHNNFKDSDLKYVKRFNDTKLSKNQFGEIVKYIKKKELLSVSTPFDNESLSLFDDLGVEVLKIASCSVDDWPLLEEASKINRKIIISTAGSTIKHIRKVYKLFKDSGRDFAFLHCIAEYPTPIENSFLARINQLKGEFPDIEIGYSTHESPDQKSVSPFAVAMGATILEKHVGKETDTIKLNDYSCTVDQMEKVIQEIQLFEKAFVGVFTKSKALEELKRGVYVNKDLSPDHIIKYEDLYYAMPSQEGYFNVSDIKNIIGKQTINSISKDEPLGKKNIIDKSQQSILNDIAEDYSKIILKGNITLTHKDEIELSCHYGLDNFREIGALIISKINRSYCKKIIAMLPNQSHPTHYHLQKEECFELLEGDCLLTLNGRDIELQKGLPILINKKVRHSFKTKNGCVIEEVSTTHIKGDSIYEDLTINKLDLQDRKIKLNYELFN